MINAHILPTPAKANCEFFVKAFSKFRNCYINWNLHIACSTAVYFRQNNYSATISAVLQAKWYIVCLHFDVAGRLDFRTSILSFTDTIRLNNFYQSILQYVYNCTQTLNWKCLKIILMLVYKYSRCLFFSVQSFWLALRFEIIETNKPR